MSIADDLDRPLAQGAGGAGEARATFAGIAALLSRSPGYSVAQKCLEVQAEAERADPTLRVAGRLRLHPDAWSWYQGALGEIAVGGMLAQLGPEWFVRHAVPIGAGTKDIDHLVIGPGGVFVINTKHHRGADVWVGDRAILVNGENRRHLESARRDAVDVTRRLAAEAGVPVRVNSVVAIHDARKLTGNTILPGDVHIVPTSGLVGWLRSQPRVVDQASLGLIRLAAEQPTTWHIDPHAADTSRVMQRFERLQRELGTVAPPTASTRAPAPAAAAFPQARPERAPRLPRATRATTRSSRGRTRRPKQTRLEKLIIGLVEIGVVMGGLWWFTNVAIPAIIESSMTP
ncbi:nuclease-related domain-containing protein [Homoserinibacter sp. YIM 151385]|uniref:nuclease-related domain-containing protein n=1 Tax=Homoserinibacter sp. YIM 151385 TaxID=2985506 RepID=UPI0022F14519|nr:nuclease-related domain-containing protein [Homoserinibacter sp. YIM 151385]WBU37875.1 nuclease-related domain-containing protein [Homoserinibacter sp. YIM 151385]